MEKNVGMVVRYQATQGYFVEVYQENAAFQMRDYWLCKRGTSYKEFLFSEYYVNDDTEEEHVIQHIRMAMRNKNRVDALLA